VVGKGIVGGEVATVEGENEIAKPRVLFAVRKSVENRM
jgi:hypothetical protein